MPVHRSPRLGTAARQLALVALTWVVAGCATSRPLPPVTAPLQVEGALRAGWADIPGPAGTGCATDSTFKLVVHPGAPDHVLLFLNGGGACWRAGECNPHGRPTYTTRADSANDPRRQGGIFALDNLANPLRDFTIVYVPYCTGDVHLGARTATYMSPPTGTDAPVSFAIRHEGAANVEFALAWIRAHVAAPSVIVVAGSSGGAIPSPVFASKLARQYPDARVVQLGDAAGGYHVPAAPALLAQWGATGYLRRDDAYRTLDSAAFTFETLYTASARAAPRVTFAQYNAAEDATQLFFLPLLGIRGVPLGHFLSEGLAEIRGAVPGFRTYTAPGRVHAILRSNAVYTTVVDGVSFSDWLAALVNGMPVRDVGDALLKS